MTADVSTAEQTERLTRDLREAIGKVAESRPFAKALHQGRVFELAVRLLKEPGGAEAAYTLAPELESAGVFYGGDWQLPEHLVPELARGSLRSEEAFTVGVEALSELRMLAIARGRIESHPSMTADDATAFLESVISSNIDLLMGASSEAERKRSRNLREAVAGLLRFTAAELGSDSLLDSVVGEVERILEQRPLLVNRVLRMVQSIQGVLRHGEHRHAGAERLVRAINGPTDRSAGATSIDAYREELETLDGDALKSEARAMGESMEQTGLVCPAHAVLLREAARRLDVDLLATALSLDGVGRDSLAAYQQLCMLLIERAVTPSTAEAVYNLATMLERGILFFPPVAPGLWRLAGLELHPDVVALLNQGPGVDNRVPPLDRLLAGTLGVLGHPLGVGQGDNPTCQSARAICLWAQSDPGFLLELITWAGRDNEVDMHFEGALLQSSQLGSGLVEDLHTELDAVSLVLVPHLDRIYMEMGRRIAGREEDGHRWINPEFHGWWVHRGFATTIQYSTGAVIDFAGFVRLFHAAYHPGYNGGRTLIYPQPAGIAATDNKGVFLGWHAVAIQRVTIDPAGEIRVYFYNPNNDGRQDWGQGIVTATSGNGEAPGESSLPFDEFASRLYVFHYNAREIGDIAAVSEEALGRITELARGSWGADRAWHDVVIA
ncbi:MAG: hypothetical protein WED00_13220 [Aquisalimonadaceae bacterium]